MLQWATRFSAVFCRRYRQDLLGWHVCRANVTRQMFFELRDCLRKMLRSFPKFIFLRPLFGGSEKSRKIPAKSPARILAEKQKKSPISFCRGAGSKSWGLVRFAGTIAEATWEWEDRRPRNPGPSSVHLASYRLAIGDKEEIDSIGLRVKKSLAPGGGEADFITIMWAMTFLW